MLKKLRGENKTKMTKTKIEKGCGKCFFISLICDKRYGMGITNRKVKFKCGRTRLCPECQKKLDNHTQEIGRRNK